MKQRSPALSRVFNGIVFLFLYLPIVVLIIFSIFLTHQSGKKLPSSKRSNLFWGGLLSVAGLLLTLGVALSHDFPQDSHENIDASVKTIGLQMLDYTNHGYALLFEVISFLLLAALVGSIAIAIKEKNE